MDPFGTTKNCPACHYEIYYESSYANVSNYSTLPSKVKFALAPHLWYGKPVPVDGEIEFLKIICGRCGYSFRERPKYREKDG